jgi:hypothetical protein
MMARQNYFLLLELDPDKATTWAAIEPQLKKKRNEWSTPHPTRKLEFQTYRGLLPDIEAVLKNDETRRNEAAEAKQLIAKRRTEALADLDQRLGVIGAKGYLAPGDIVTLVAAGGKKWTEPDVRERAAKLGLEIKQVAATKPAGVGIDDVTRTAIAKALSIVGAEDLYALLALPRMTSTAELKRAADAEYQRVRTHGDKSKPEVNARQELYGHCLKLFDSNAERAKYDYSLSRVRLAEIESLTAEAGSGEGRIGVRVMDELINRGKQKGIAKEDVIECVQAVAKKKGWLVELPNQPEADQRELCRFCQTLGAVRATACAQCGTPFRRACPKCGDVNSSFVSNCSKCRFAICDMPLAERCLNSSKGIATTDLPSALREVDQALAYWPGHPYAVAWRAKLEAELLEVAKRRQRIPELQMRFQQQWATRHVQGGCRTLQELRQLDPQNTDLPKWLPLVEAAERAAAAEIAAGREHLKQGRFDGAFGAFEKALAEYADNAEAMEALKACPPAPPSAATASASLAGVTLRWCPSPSRGRLEYVVLRKNGSPPTRFGDGVEVAITSAATHLDADAPSGQRLHYAVFARRLGVVSHQAAHAAPAVRPDEVRELAAQGGNGSVTLTWKPPSGAIRIEVWRKLHGEPARAGDGERVTCGLNTVVDSRRTNGIPVGYRVVAVFQNVDGQELASPGVTCLATPMQPPPPVAMLELKLRTGGYTASYSPPVNGIVRVFASMEPREFPPGHVLSARELATLDRPLAAAGPGTVSGTLAAGQTELFLLPVTIDGATHVAGTPLARSWVPDVEKVVAEFREESLMVSWSWPAGVERAVLVVDGERFAVSPTVANAVRVTPVTAEQMRVSGGKVRIEVPFCPRLYLTVFAEINRRGTRQFASGTTPGARCEIAPRVHRVASYTIRSKRKGLFGPGNYAIEMKADGPVELPELLVVSKPEGLPLAPDDGTVIYKVKPQRMNGGALTEVGLIESPAWRLSRDNTSLFHAREDDGRWLELLRGR